MLKSNFQRIGAALLSISLAACGTTYKPMTYESGSPPKAKITTGVVVSVRDVQLPKAKLSGTASSGSKIGSTAGEAGYLLGGNIGLVFVGSVVGGLAGIVADATASTTVSGQEIVIQPEGAGKKITIVQPDTRTRLNAGEKVRIYEGSFTSRLERISS